MAIPMYGPASIFLLTLGYGALHSLLASLPAKAAARRWFGPVADRVYRIMYNLVAVLTLLPVLSLLLHNMGPVLVALSWPLWLVALAAQGALLGLMYVSFLQSDPQSFFGIRQLGGLPETPRLLNGGAYRVVRHPLYTLGLAILWCVPILTAGTLALDLAITLYILIGSELEERRLMVQFGDEYRRYRGTVARLIPFIF
jgi:protein-S-isoprenylcysteine O-methyltransferase Ste14